jgi:hypothetical protein
MGRSLLFHWVASVGSRGGGGCCFGFGGLHRRGAVLWNFNGIGRRKMLGDVRQSLVLLLTVASPFLPPLFARRRAIR